jgi:hypothetical protein
MPISGGTNEIPLWGLVPEGTARARLLRPGAPTAGVPALEIGPGFRRRFYLVAWTPGIRTAVALDEQGRLLARVGLP